MRGHKDLRLLVAVSVLCALLALVIPLDVVRLAFALPLALFLPGYAIAVATFARRPLERPKLLLLGAGLSLALLPFGALVLNYAPGGIRAGSWALLLVLVVLAACLAAARRRPRGSGGALAIPRPHPNAATTAVLGLAALAVAAALVLAFIPLPAKHAVGYTELWIQPAGGAAARIGVRSDEQQQASYQLVVHFGSGKHPTVRRFVLDPGESRILRVTAEANDNAQLVSSTQPVSAVLYRSGHKGAYRRVSTWIPSPGAAQ